MSEVRSRISEEIKTAMKAKDQLRLDTLRMIKAEIIKAETSSKASEMDEAGLIKLLQTMKKQRLDAAQQFEKGGRNELAEKEHAEIAVIETFLPTQLEDDALLEIVAATAAEENITDMKGMGLLMKSVMTKVTGRADGSRVSAMVKHHLSGQ